MLVKNQELCQSGGGHPGLLVPNKPGGCCGRKAKLKPIRLGLRPQELCESRGGHPGLPVPNRPCGFCGRKATLNEIVLVTATTYVFCIKCFSFKSAMTRISAECIATKTYQFSFHSWRYPMSE